MIKKKKKNSRTKEKSRENEQKDYLTENGLQRYTTKENTTVNQRKHRRHDNLDIIEHG